MKAELKEHIDKNLPFLNHKKLLIAISGGIDSVVLTRLMKKLNFDISLAHCNFTLRGKESNKDEQFVIDLGEKMQVPTYTIKFETEKYANEKGLSTQMAARELRYNWFDNICKEQQIDYLITAHHKDDVLETFLINLTRGTGLDGLTSIPEINGNIVRPLLPFTQNEILVYAAKNKLQWREDKSNSSIKYVRNKIRHKVIPILKELNPSLLETFYQTLNNLKASQQIVKDRIQNVNDKVSTVHKTETHFDILKLKKLSDPKIYLYELLKNYGFTEWDDVTNLLDAQSGKQVFSKTHRLVKDRDCLILSKISKSPKTPFTEIHKGTSQISVPINLTFETINIPFDNKNHQQKIIEELVLNSPQTITIDADKITFPLTLRKWQKGDFFYPIGLQGKKKVSKFFKDEKMSILEKENVWLLCSNNDIIWVIGQRLDERFKVTESTCSILKVTL